MSRREIAGRVLWYLAALPVSLLFALIRGIIVL